MMPPRSRLLLSLVFLVPVGLVTKVWTGPGADLVRGHVGGFFYVVFWTLLVLLVRPSTPPAVAAIAILLATCAVETLQLWHPAWLESLRESAPGALVLGRTFSWWDFPPYAAGALAGWAWGRAAARPRSPGSAG